MSKVTVRKKTARRKRKEKNIYKPDENLTENEKINYCEKFHKLRKECKEKVICPVPFCWKTAKHRNSITHHHHTRHTSFPLICNKDGCEKECSSLAKWKSHQTKRHHVKIPRMARLPEVLTVKDYLEDFQKKDIPYYTLIHEYYQKYLEREEINVDEERGENEGEDQVERVDQIEVLDQVEDLNVAESTSDCASCNQLLNKIKEYDQDAINFDELVAGLAEDKTRLEKEKTRLKVEKNRLKIENNRLKIENNRLKNENNRLKVEKTDLANTRKTLSTQTVCLVKKVQEYQREIANQNLVISGLENGRDADVQCEDLGDTVENSEKERIVREWNEKLKETEKLYEEKITKLTDDHANEMKLASEIFDNSKKDCSKLSTSVERSEEQALKLVRRLKNAERIYRKELAHFEIKIDDLKAQLAKESVRKVKVANENWYIAKSRYTKVCESFRLLAYHILLKYNILLESTIELKTRAELTYFDEMEIDKCQLECGGVFSKKTLMQLFSSHLWDMHQKWDLDLNRTVNGLGTMNVMLNKMKEQQKRLNPGVDFNLSKHQQMKIVYGNYAKDFVHRWLKLGSDVEERLRKDRRVLTLEDFKTRSLLMDGLNMACQESNEMANVEKWNWKLVYKLVVELYQLMLFPEIILVIKKHALVDERNREIWKKDTNGLVKLMEMHRDPKYRFRIIRDDNYHYDDMTIVGLALKFGYIVMSNDHFDDLLQKSNTMFNGILDKFDEDMIERNNQRVGVVYCNGEIVPKCNILSDPMTMSKAGELGLNWKYPETQKMRTMKKGPLQEPDEMDANIKERKKLDELVASKSLEIGPTNLSKIADTDDPDLKNKIDQYCRYFDKYKLETDIAGIRLPEPEL